MLATGMSWVRGWKKGRWAPRPCTKEDAYSVSVGASTDESSGRLQCGYEQGIERGIERDSPCGVKAFTYVNQCKTRTE